MKRFLASLLAVLMLVSLLPLSAFAAETKTATVADAQEPAQIVKQQLVLGDNLNMRFWVKANMENAAINVTIGSGETKSIALTEKDADGNYVINVALAAAQMTDVITLQPVAGDVTGTAKQYTVRQYAEVILKGEYAEPVKNLVQAMLNYGAGAQVYFDYNNTADQLANKGYENDAVVTLPEELAITTEGATEGVRFYGASLSFRDRIALRYYFTGDISGMTVNAGEKAYTVGQKDGLSYVELADINPQDYATVYTVTVGEGEGALSVGYSAMHYISRMGTRGSEELVNLLKALLAYHGAALSYLEWLASCDNLADFAVVYGDNATDNEKTARDMIVEYIQKSTGVTLPIIPAREASYTADAKYLVIGDTGLGGFAPAADLGLRGYQIKSMGNSVFVCGGTDLGTLSGAVGFLEQVIGLDAYGYQTVNYNKLSEILINNFDLIVVPDVGMEQPPFSMVSGSAWNQALWGVGQKMFSTIEGSSNHWHNSFDYLPPSEYLDSHPEYYVTEGYPWNKKAVQLSYTANGVAEAFEEMTTICANKIISSAEKNPSMKAVTLTMEDNGSWDKSPSAQALHDQYGTHSAEVIIFVNAVADKVKAELGDRELDIYFFAYYNTYAAPVKEVDGKLVAIDSKVEMRDNVGVMYAPINDDFLADDFKDTKMYEELSGWAALTDNIATWMYQTNFDNYFNFYNSFNIMPSMYQAMADFGVVYSHNQGQWNNPNSTGFSHLKTYLTGKLSWNAYADFETLLDNYFASRFGSAAGEMRTLFDSMRAYYDKLQDTYNIDGGINESAQYLRTDRFEKAEIEKWLGYIDAAYAKADNDTIKGYITLESLAVRYLMLELYADTMNTNDRMVMMQAFKQDCAAQNIQMFSEGKAIDYLWEQWDSGNIQEIEGIYYNFDLSLGLTSYEIPVPASVGTITAVYDNGYIALDGVSIGANSITFSSEAVNTLLNGKSYGDFALYLTTADQIYKVNVAVVTQMIDSYDDLVAIKANQDGNVLDGYYALANDIDATGEDAICLIEYNDAMWQSYSSGVGFKGIFDGRGYTISNLTAKTGSYAKIGGFFGQILQSAVIRDIAFMDMTTDNANTYTYLLTGESCRMMGTISNVVISAKGDVQKAFGFIGCNPTTTENASRGAMINVVVSGVDNLGFTIMNVPTIKNVIVVADTKLCESVPVTDGDKAVYDSITCYSNNDAMFAALNEENMIAGWENCDITYENTAIKFNGKAIITELMNIAETEAIIGGSTNLTVQGSVTLALKEAVEGVSLNGNTLTAASTVKAGTKVTVVATSTVSGVTKEFVITLLRTYTDAVLGAMDVEIGAESASMAVSGIAGNAECLIYGTTTVYEGYTIADGQLTISKDLLDAMYTKLGLGEQTIYLGTDAAVRYAITLTIATKIINTVEDLESISTTEATLDGYYVLNADLDCSGKTIALLAGAQNCYEVSNVGFFGTFDGRGHTISNLTTKNGSYHELGGVFGQLCAGAVVKNVAFVNLTNTTKNPNGVSYLLTGDGSVLYGTLENVAVIGNDSKARVVSALTNASGKIENCFFANIGEISSNGDKAVVNYVLSATELGRNTDTGNPWGGFAWSGNVNYNAQPNYVTVNDMIIALSANNIIADWTDAMFTYADGQILYNGKLLVQYDLDLRGADTIYRGTSQTYLSANLIDLMLKEEIDGVSVELTETDEENGIDIFTLTVDASVPAGTEIILVAYSWEFESVTKEIVVTVQKQYTDIDLTAEGNMADIEVTSGASVAVRFTVEGIGYGDSGMVTEGISYADGKLSLTKAAIDAIVAEVGLGEKTLKLYTTDDKCYTVIVTFATKIINTQADLLAISTTSSTLYGYYVLGSDIECDGTTVIRLVNNDTQANNNVGFFGTFDGRGHTISNLKTSSAVYNGLGGLFGMINSGAVVKNVAFVNMVDDTRGLLLSGESRPLMGTLENVVVHAKSNAKSYILSNLGQASGVINNCLFLNVTRINMDGGAAKISNVASVTATDLSGTGGFSWSGNAAFNAQKNYTSTNALMTALDSNNFFANWTGSMITYADGKISFNGKVIAAASLTLTGAEVIIRGTSETYVSDGIITLKTPIDGVSIENGVLSVANTVAENTIITLVATHKAYPAITTELNVQVTKVYEYIDWTDLGSIGDLETSEANSYIQLPADINGNVIGVSYGENGMSTDVSVTNGVLSIPKAWVTEVYNAYGYTEQSIKLYTDADKCYTVKTAIVTKAIGTFDELKSIAVSGNTLDGYYVLTNDIDCNGKNIYLVGAWSGSTTTGFIGTLDGRGHAIDSFNTDWGLFYVMGAGVVKNVAFTNTVGENDRQAVLANGEVHGATIENVFVSGNAKNLTGGLWDGAVLKNVVFATSNANASITTTGSNSPVTMTNVFVVGAKLYDYLNKTPVLTNTNVFADTNALLAAFGAEGELDKWTDSGFSMEDGKLLFFGREVVTPVYTYEEIDLTAKGNIGDLETSEDYSYITLPAEIEGNVTGVSFAGSAPFTDVSVADGKLAIAKAGVTAIYSVAGYGEQTVLIHTDANKNYAVTVTVVTKAIGTWEELKSIYVKANTMDGYYVLTNDIDCNGQNVYLIETGGSNPSQGFIGTFDGRGYAIDRFNTKWGLFYTLGGGVVKNIAFTNTIGNRPVLANAPVYGATIENIFVSGEASHLVGGLWNATTVKNVVFTSNYANAAINDTGGDGVNVLTNVFVVGSAVHGYLNTTPELTNTNVFTDTTALIAALSAEGELDKWADSGFSVEDGKLLFWDRVVIG